MKSSRSSNRVSIIVKQSRSSQPVHVNAVHTTEIEDLICAVVQRYVADIKASRNNHANRLNAS